MSNKTHLGLDCPALEAKCAEQAKTIEGLRKLLGELHGQVPHTCATDATDGMCVGCAYDNEITVTLAETAALKEAKRLWAPTTTNSNADVAIARNDAHLNPPKKDK